MTEEEFKRHTGFIPAKEYPTEIEDLEDFTPINGGINWVDKGAVTSVKNQGSCGSCWAFSAIGAMEGRYQIAHGALISQSEQELVDCSTSNHGCRGGSMELAFQYFNSHLTERENDYPYTAKDGTCKYN